MNIFHDMMALLINSIIQYLRVRSLRRSGSRSVSRDHSGNGRSNEPMNPCPEWIHRFIWSTMIRVISEHWSWSESSQRNAPEVISRARIGQKLWSTRVPWKWRDGVALHCRLRPRAWGSGFYLSFENFEVISKVDKSQDHGKVLSIFV